MLPLGLGALLYIWQSLNYLGVRRIGMMLAFIGYTIGNIGLIIDFYESKLEP